MTIPAPTTLYRFAADGRLLGFIVVDRPIEQYASRIGVDLCTDEPPTPGAGQFAKRVNGAWQLVADLPGALTLAAVRERKWLQMKAARRSAMEAPLSTPFGTFDADDDSRNNIIQTAHLMQTQAQSLAPATVPTVAFTLANNSTVTLTAGQMVEVALLLAAQIQGAYDRGRQLRAAIDAATTAAEVDAITWSTP